MSAASDQARELDRLLDKGIKPHADEIARIYGYGDVAVVFFEVAASVTEAARAMGWTGKTSEVARMRAKRAEAMAANLAEMGDHTAARWLRTSRPNVARIFVVMGDGTLCVNYEQGQGFSIEPGTLEASSGRGKA